MKFWKNTATLDDLVPELLETAPDAEAELAVIGSRPIDLDALPSLKGIFKCGVGTDNVPFDEAEKRGIEVCMPSYQTRRYIFEETANFAVQLVFRMLFDDIGEVDSWTKRSRPFLGNRRVLVIGHGNIGRMVETKLAPSVTVETYDVLENTEEELEAMVRRADVVTLHTPLLDETRGFIDAEKLGWMKDGAALVNTARGPIVDEDALYAEISSGRLRAAFDVYWQEPYEGKLKEFHPDRFLMSPHVASNCADFQTGLASDLRDFIQRLS
jgi:phosphoglycerate dehydrogenase-like enzyme